MLALIQRRPDGACSTTSWTVPDGDRRRGTAHRGRFDPGPAQRARPRERVCSPVDGGVRTRRDGRTPSPGYSTGRRHPRGGLRRGTRRCARWGGSAPRRAAVGRRGREEDRQRSRTGRGSGERGRERSGVGEFRADEGDQVAPPGLFKNRKSRGSTGDARGALQKTASREARRVTRARGGGRRAGDHMRRKRSMVV